MMKKFAIIGAGNMGGAIAVGLSMSSYAYTLDIWVSDPDEQKLSALRRAYPNLHTTTDSFECAQYADYVLLAVKPWLVEQVLKSLQLQNIQMLISIAAGVRIASLKEWMGHEDAAIFRAIPNTAIRYRQSMTILAQEGASKEQLDDVKAIFDVLGSTILMEEDKMVACTAVSSCGIAYVLKYVHASMQAGVELGLKPHDAQVLLAQTLKGAAALLEQKDAHPAVEIDKVCTPGGLTIKGINALEEGGFSAAVIKAIKASI